MLWLDHIRFDILREIIVKDFSLTLAPGQIKTLFGPSGCGKTSILRLISGLEEPKHGHIRSTYQKLGLMFQENRLLPHMTALENIKLFMPHPSPQKILKTANTVGLSESDLNKYPVELSGGMARRVAFLRLYLSDCNLALLDEPFVGLDRDLRQRLATLLIEKVEQQGLACLLVTHDRFEAARLSHEVLFLSAKEMQIEKIVYLNEKLSTRHNQYEEQIVTQHFSNVIYYE